MNYKYYELFETGNHLLYPKEIAELAGIINKNGEPASVFVSVLLSDNTERKIYYNTRNGLRRVYSAYDICDLIKNLCIIDNNFIITYKAKNNKTYTAYLKGENTND